MHEIESVHSALLFALMALGCGARTELAIADTTAAFDAVADASDASDSLTADTVAVDSGPLVDATDACVLPDGWTPPVCGPATKGTCSPCEPCRKSYYCLTGCCVPPVD